MVTATLCVALRSLTPRLLCAVDVAITVCCPHPYPLPCGTCGDDDVDVVDGSVGDTSVVAPASTTTKDTHENNSIDDR